MIKEPGVESKIAPPCFEIHILHADLHRTWNIPAVATVLASAANYMICDDHEFVDNLGETSTWILLIL